MASSGDDRRRALNVNLVHKRPYWLLVAASNQQEIATSNPWRHGTWLLFIGASQGVLEMAISPIIV